MTKKNNAVNKINNGVIDFSDYYNDICEANDTRVINSDNFGRDVVKPTIVEDNDVQYERVKTLKDYVVYDIMKWFNSKIVSIRKFWTTDNNGDKILHHCLIELQTEFGKEKFCHNVYTNRIIFNAIMANAGIFNVNELLGKKCFVNFTQYGKYTNTYIAFDKNQVVERISDIVKRQKSQDALDYTTDCSQARAILEDNFED